MLGRTLILLGILLILIGLFYNYGGKVPFFGKLPGDIVIKRENFTFYFPLATSILISLLLTLILFLLGKWR